MYPKVPLSTLSTPKYPKVPLGTLMYTKVPLKWRFKLYLKNVTQRRTDGPTDKAGVESRSTWLKMNNENNFRTLGILKFVSLDRFSQFSHCNVWLSPYVHSFLRETGMCFATSSPPRLLWINLYSAVNWVMMLFEHWGLNNSDGWETQTLRLLRFRDSVYPPKGRVCQYAEGFFESHQY